MLVKFLAALVPVCFGYVFSRRLKREREQMRGLAEPEDTLLIPRADALISPLPLLMPIIALIFLISYLTSLLFGLFGIEGAPVGDAPILEMLLLHSLLPALLEESVFRYLPIILIAPYSKRWCAVLSAVYFALVHMSLIQLPYALCAGFIFVILDLAYDSVWPSFILHLCNNAVSVLWIKYSYQGHFATWFVVVLVAAAILSLVGAYFKRREYLSGIKKALDEGENLTEYYSPMLLICFCVVMICFNTFA